MDSIPLGKDVFAVYPNL